MRTFGNFICRKLIVVSALFFLSFSLFAYEDKTPSNGISTSAVIMHVAPLINDEFNWGFESDWHFRFDYSFLYLSLGLQPKFNELSKYSDFKAYPELFLGMGLYKDFSAIPVGIYVLGAVGMLHRDGNLLKSFGSEVVEVLFNSLFTSEDEEWVHTKSYSHFNADLRAAAGIEYILSDSFRVFSQLSLDCVMNWYGYVGLNKNFSLGVGMNF